jgi:uncharacterized protein (DUF885 family)
MGSGTSSGHVAIVARVVLAQVLPGTDAAEPHSSPGHRHRARHRTASFVFHDHSAIAEVGVQSETDRYIASPGQALGYKVGQLTILRLRSEAQEALGTKFDIRAFHDEVLGAGALPMDRLERRIHAWIERTKTAR